MLPIEWRVLDSNCNILLYTKNNILNCIQNTGKQAKEKRGKRGHKTVTKKS